MSMSEFHSSGNLEKSWSADWLNHFIPVQLKEELHWKLSGLPSGRLSSVHLCEPQNIQVISYLDIKPFFGFVFHSAAFIGMNGSLPPSLYPALFIRPWWSVNKPGGSLKGHYKMNKDFVLTVNLEKTTLVQSQIKRIKKKYRAGNEVLFKLRGLYGSYQKEKPVGLLIMEHLKRFFTLYS